MEEDLAGWDLEALQQAFGRIVDEMASRAEVQALFTVLDGVARMRGTHAPPFRAFVAHHLADPARLARVVVLATAPENYNEGISGSERGFVAIDVAMARANASSADGKLLEVDWRIVDAGKAYVNAWCLRS